MDRGNGSFDSSSVRLSSSRSLEVSRHGHFPFAYVFEDRPGSRKVVVRCMDSAYLLVALCALAWLKRPRMCTLFVEGPVN
jgi:hypothetical protein